MAAALRPSRPCSAPEVDALAICTYQLQGRTGLTGPSENVETDRVRRGSRWRGKRLPATQSHRRACGQPGALPAHAARHEPGEAGRKAWPDLPADPEVRKGHQ